MTDYTQMLGQRVRKTGSSKTGNSKPFKSGLKVNTVRSIILHPILLVPAFQFLEDDSYVACRNCELAPVDAEPPAVPAAPVVVRLIRERASDGPISGKAITERMMRICGCQGQFDCDCVSCENQARRELWTEHNTAENASTA